MSSVEAHYSSSDLGERILAALDACGADMNALTIEDLAPVDAFHIRGREATVELAELARIGKKDRVLDAGCGIGGTCRYLAATRGCSVVGVDLTEEHISVAKMLSERVGLAAAIEFRRGSVLELPFPNDHFDIAWTEHAQMNIAEKAAFYGELFRVLKPGGKLAFHDIFAGPGGDVYYPVPWAADAGISHLMTIEALRDVLGKTGFSQLAWEDKTGASAEFFRSVVSRGPAALGPHLVMRAAGTKIPNLLRSLEEGRVCVVQAVMTKPS
jgi:SAM-dependent methyltransferase